MNADMTPRCSLGLTTETLSAWRDDALGPREMARVGAHARGCAACQARLGDYDVVARTVRGQRVAVPDARLWRGVRDRIMMEHNMKEHGGRRDNLGRSGGGHGRAWTGWAAVAAAVLLVGGFALVIRGFIGGRGTTVPMAVTSPAMGTPSVTPATTAAPTPPPLALAWQAVQLPAGFGTRWSYLIAPAATDGETAYACGMPIGAGETTTGAWTTHDRGAHWARVILPVGHVANACTPITDGNDSRVAVMWVTWGPLGAPPDATDAADFVTYDGGASWQRVPVALAHRPMLATWHGVTYGTGVADKGSQLWVTSDNMRTWQPVGDGTLPVIGQIWVDPGTGALTAVQEPPGGGVSVALQIWTSPDGHTWRRESTPKLAEVVSGPVTAGAASPRLALCGLDSLGQTANLLCADASGTWVGVPNLVLTGANASGQAMTASGYPFAIASDGALLATAAWPTPTDTALYRLTPGASAWQSMGAAPLPLVAFGATASGGVIWATENGAYTVSYP